MATVVLGIGGQVLGGMLGGPVGAMIGRAVGALAGSMIDSAIINSMTPPKQGPRLTTQDIQTSTEGQPVNRLIGRVRTVGQIIWATRFEERSTTTGGKGTQPTPVVTEYSYFGNFAVGLAEGPIAGIGRVWADGKELDRTQLAMRVYLGGESQEADPLIEAKEGTAPAYRGLAYVVFEGLPLAPYGNRLPQMSFEVFRPVGELESMAQGVALLPGNEFGFDPQKVSKLVGFAQQAENRHTLVAGTDILESLDRLEMTLPNVGNILLVVPWYGTDLRVGNCTIEPCVDAKGKATTPHSWQVGTLNRDSARLVTQINNTAAYGGSPSDQSLLRGIAELKRRGFKVMLLPFIQMDVAPGNSLPNPYGGTGQPAFPWRGRITCNPAPGRSGSPDKSATITTNVATFMGSATASSFSWAGSTLNCSVSDWGYARFILHLAHIAARAGGVDSFLIGSEMIGLTQLRDGSNAYPFVNALVSLATQVRAVLPAAQLGYAADWSEYNSHRPGDASGDLYFNLDPIWSASTIDFIGIDNYLPLADWRDGFDHLDFDPMGPISPYDRDYLKANVRGGEGFDWYYASQSDRDSQTRTAITDGGYGKPWVYRQKAIHEWWSNSHFNRPGGTESGTATSWVPQSKPIVFVELGCPAVDKGANQPNVFPDPKSSENFLPYYSTGRRDDQAQRAYLEAMLGFYAEAANNPVSSVYGGRMLDLSRTNLWCWDARPAPSFPLDERWGDWANFDTGHWLSGRMGMVPGREALHWLMGMVGFSQHQVEYLPGWVDGITLGNLGSPRTAIETLQGVFQFDAVESEGVLKFLARPGRGPVAQLSADDLIAENGGGTYRLTRGQETELPAVVKLQFGDWTREDQAGQAEARRPHTISRKVVVSNPPVTMAIARARQVAEDELRAAWVAQERAGFTLPPSRFALDPGDVVELATKPGHPALHLRLATVGHSIARKVEAFAVETSTIGGATVTVEPVPVPGPMLTMPAMPVFVDGPLLADADPDHAGYVAGAMLPWGAGMALFRSATESGFALDSRLLKQGRIGQLVGELWSGPAWRWDMVNTVRVQMVSGQLESAEPVAVLNGSNALLVENADGEWELLQWTTAELTAERTYALRGLLRGQRGTEHAMRSPVAAGARVVVVDGGLLPTGLPPEMMGLDLIWRAGPILSDSTADSYTQTVQTMTGKARRPYSPCGLWGVRDHDSGDWEITWKRRTRLGGDSWDQAEVPLGEETEAYQLEILDGDGEVVRTFTATTTSQTYTSAQQTTDFGGQSWGFSARVAQSSATYGLGKFHQSYLWVRG